tara:strand:- start:4221 stop:5417 length:1197 start_codon:yes stop_codon:yes gene_type:complete
MKIALINLPSPFLIDDKVFPPLGILYIASALRKEGHEPVWYDFAGGKGFTRIEEEIIFITVTSPQVPLAIMFVEHERQFGKKKVVIGGCGVVSIKGKAKNLFDIRVHGEGENVLKEILHMIGHSYESALVRSKKVADINTIPFPARDLISGYNYEVEGRRTTTAITSRGCPFSCSFCVDGSTKIPLRLTSAERVCEEIDEIEKLGYRSIMFFDDILTLKLGRLLHITSHLMVRGIIYRCFTHVNFVNEDMAKMLAMTGCKEVGIGIESGSNRILGIIKKKFTSDKALKAIELLNAHGINVKAFLMVGLPTEDRQSIAATKYWLSEARPYLNDFDISLYMPFPSTEIWDKKKDLDITWNGNMSGFYKGKPGEYRQFVSTKSLTAEELLDERNAIEKEFK